MRRKNDILWKGMLEQVFDDFLRFVFPNAGRLFDMGKGFEFLDKELGEMYPEPEKAAATRYVDKLVKVYLRDGKEHWLLVHIEVQGWKDEQFAKRMFTYYYRILDRHNIPVTAIAIFTGPDGNKMPNKFEDRCLGTHLLYQYNTLQPMDYSDKALAASDNPFALVILAAKKALLAGRIPEEELLKQKLLIAKLLLKKGLFSKRKIAETLSFLNSYVVFKKPETNRIFEGRLDELTGKKNTMGVIEQIAEIRAKEAEEKASRRFVRNLLKESDFSLEKIASLANVSLEFVKKLKATQKKR